MMLNNRLRILRHELPLEIPGFLKSKIDGHYTLAPEKVLCGDWFERFHNRVAEAIRDKAHLPICRFSDGEMAFMFGHVYPSPRLPVAAWVRAYVASLYRFHFARMFRASTTPTVPVGLYKNQERRLILTEYRSAVAALLGEGILAFHLSYGPEPFQEQYFPAIQSWLTSAGVTLTFSNYVPFYFVYALLRGPRRAEILHDKSVLVVHGATGPKRQNIVRGLKREGVKEVIWIEISGCRSLFDRLVIPREYNRRFDLVLIGAGIGKPLILRQLRSVEAPCIDAGYLFEVWAEDTMKWKRMFCVNDDEFDLDAVEFFDSQRKAAIRRRG